MSTDFTVIEFTESGEVTAMHRDSFSLGFLGKQSISRASEIMFNEDTQRWDIHLASPENGTFFPTPASGFVGYNEARDVEVAWLENCRLHDVEALSDRGISILEEIMKGVQ